MNTRSLSCCFRCRVMSAGVKLDARSLNTCFSSWVPRRQDGQRLVPSYAARTAVLLSECRNARPSTQWSMYITLICHGARECARLSIRSSTDDPTTLIASGPLGVFVLCLCSRPASSLHQCRVRCCPNTKPAGYDGIQIVPRFATYVYFNCVTGSVSDSVMSKK